MESESKRARADLQKLVTANKSRGLEPRFEKMLSVIKEMNTTLDPDELFPVALKKTVEIFEAERGFLTLGVAPDQLRFQTTTTFDGQPIEQPENEVSRAVIAQVASDRAPVLVKNALADERFANVSSVLDLELCSVMCAPLAVEGELLGVVYLDNRTLSGVFEETDLNLLVLFAEHAAIAIRNAQLFDKLKEARAELLHAERLKAVGEMAAIVAHKVRSPLTSIKLMVAQMPERQDDPEFLREYPEIVDEEIDRLSNIVEGLLVWSKAPKPVRWQVNVVEVIDATLGLFQSELDEAGVCVTRDYAPSLPPVEADGEGLREVFSNLLKNGIEALASCSAKTITVTATEDEDGVRVCIEDTGPGIDPEIEDKLFELYSTDKEKGTGLGLAIAAKIVFEHGGTITGENRPEGGACFEIILPSAE